MAKKIIIREDQLKDIVKGKARIMGHTMDRLSIDFDNMIKGKLNEGYYRTYPADKVMAYIRKLFGNSVVDIIKIDNPDNTIPNIVVCIKKGMDHSDIDKAMALCGYSLDSASDYQYGDAFPKYKNTVDLQYSPIYSELKDVHNEQDYLYHASPIYYKEKILKKGLSPKSSNFRFKYPDRVYLFVESYETNGEEHNMDMDELLDRCSVLYDTLRDKVGGNDGSGRDTRFDDIGTWTIYKIDVRMLNPSIKFYNDNNWDGSVYTTSNIPPSAIIEYFDYYLDDEEYDFDITEN